MPTARQGVGHHVTTWPIHGWQTCERCRNVAAVIGQVASRVGSSLAASWLATFRCRTRAT